LEGLKTGGLQRWQGLDKIEVFGPNGTLLVQNWTQNGDDEVSEVRGTFVKLQPANDAMIG
jgi:hypothetical protein